MPSTGCHGGARQLRRDLTAVERKLWNALRANALGTKFRRQHPVPPFVADFACVEAALIVEVDGGQHGSERDAIRDAALQAEGWLVLRFWNNEVQENLPGVVVRIVETLSVRRGAPHPSRSVAPSPRPSPVKRERE
jgi:very-short-patch-repair endonuclease